MNDPAPYENFATLLCNLRPPCALQRERNSHGSYSHRGAGLTLSASLLDAFGNEVVSFTMTVSRSRSNQREFHLTLLEMKS